MNRSNSFVFAIVPALLVMLVACPAFGRTLWIDYTDGDEVRACDPYLNEGDIYSMRFNPNAASRINKVWFKTDGVGTVELHLWKDKDGQPDPDGDLMPPVEVTTENGMNHQIINIEGQNVVIDPPLPFHVGLVRKTDEGAALCMDPSKDWALRAKYRLNNVWTENEYDWFVKIEVDYSNEPETFYFSDVTQQAGLESLGSRVAAGDYDNDGDPDLLFSGRILYQNQGDGTFTDVSEAAGISALPSNGGLWADFDNDGDLDFFAMVSSLEDFDRFIQNNGDGTFTDITEAALSEADRDLFPSEGAGWGDYDLDGFVDLYLANYEMPGEELSIGTRDKLYHNNGDGTFTDVADALGIDPETEGGDYMCGRGVNWGDFNNDGHPDIYVSNYRLDPNFLYVNNGDGTFTESAEALGVQGYNVMGSWGHTIGSAWGDFNNDGLLDLFNANLAHPRFANFSDPSLLFFNNGPGNWDFTDVSREAQLIYIETNSEPCLGDFNNDGWLDVMVTNVYEGFWEQLYRNDADGSLTELTFFSGLDIENGWGAAFVDYDGDGYLDVVSNKGLFQNNGNENRWIKVKLKATEGDPFCIGCKVALQVAHDQGEQIKEVVSGKGTTNSPPFVLHFGLAACESAWKITATFLNGEKVTLYEVDAEQTVEIQQGDPSDDIPETPGEPGTCAEVSYPDDTWPDEADDDDDDDDADDDDDPDGGSGGDDDDDSAGCCG